MKDNDSTKSCEAIPLPTPLPPSIDELIDEAIKKIEASCDSPGSEEERTRLSNLIENFYIYYPEINALDILDRVIKDRQSAKRFPTDIPTFSFIFYRWIEALINAKKELPGEIKILKEAVSLLNEYPNYPFNEDLDRDLIKRAIDRFPDIDIISQIDRKIIWWNDHPNALKADKTLRMQLWEWFELEDKFQLKKRQKAEPY